MKLFEIFLYILLVWNLIVYVVYTVDKQRARHKQWRVPESVLLTLAFAAGGLGALLGMIFNRHKIRQLKFKILVPAALIIQIIILFGLRALQLGV